jgi:hypothetical protein
MLELLLSIHSSSAHFECFFCGMFEMPTEGGLGSASLTGFPI